MEAANMRQSAPQCFQVATVLGLLLLVAPFTATRPSATNQGTKQSSLILPDSFPPVERVQLHEFSFLKLNCTSESSQRKNATWSKDGNSLERASMSSFKVQLESGTSQLFIEKANASDIGDYKCSSGDTVLRSFIVRAKPRVKFNITSFQASQTVAISETWIISCIFWSANYALDANISLVRCEKAPEKGDNWCGRPSLLQLQKDTAAWVSENSARVSLGQLSTENGTAVAVTIRQTHYQDIGYYMCVGRNFLQSSQTGMLLRVRDRCDFVWPSILLAGLTMYLFALVAVFEGRRIQATSFLKLEWDKIN